MKTATKITFEYEVVDNCCKTSEDTGEIKDYILVQSIEKQDGDLQELAYFRSTPDKFPENVGWTRWHRRKDALDEWKNFYDD